LDAWLTTIELNGKAIKKAPKEGEFEEDSTLCGALNF